MLECLEKKEIKSETIMLYMNSEYLKSHEEIYSAVYFRLM